MRPRGVLAATNAHLAACIGSPPPRSVRASTSFSESAGIEVLPPAQASWGQIYARCDRTGGPAALLENSGVLVEPTGLAVLASGLLAVSDCGSNQIVILDPAADRGANWQLQPARACAALSVPPPLLTHVHVLFSETLRGLCLAFGAVVRVIGGPSVFDRPYSIEALPPDSRRPELLGPYPTPSSPRNTHTHAHIPPKPHTHPPLPTNTHTRARAHTVRTRPHTP